MITRAAAGFVLLAIMFAVIFFAPIWAVPIAVAFISVLAVQEILVTTGFIKNKRIVGYALVISAVIPVWVFFGADDSFIIS